MGYVIRAAMVDRKIPAHISTPLKRVICENGRVIGVEAERAGKPWRIRAHQGVVLAIGGYDWHPDFPKYFEGLPSWKSMCQPHVEGDNIIIGGEIGAALAGVPSYNLGMFFGYRISGEEHEGKPLHRASWEGGYPHAIWVNKEGKRFGDESFYRDYLPACHAWDGITQSHPNLPPFLIFDQNYREKYAFATYMPGMPVPENILKKGNTPAELAQQLGVDPDALTATIERFNHHAHNGEDPDFNRGRYPWAAMMTGDHSRPNPNIGPLDKPPFYGIALEPVGVGVNAVGLRTNEFGQVMHVRGQPIEGFYAAGNSAAALDIGAGYQSGLSNLRGLTWGYLAARHAVGLT
jgi:3-oxosteroid 1-dehydrogenase